MPRARAAGPTAEPGRAALDAGGQVIVEIDGILVLAHSKAQGATTT